MAELVKGYIGFTSDPRTAQGAVEQLRQYHGERFEVEPEGKGFHVVVFLREEEMTENRRYYLSGYTSAAIHAAQAKIALFAALAPMPR